MKRLQDSFFAGGIGGGVQVLVGQPFDTIKTRLQNSQRLPWIKSSLPSSVRMLYAGGTFALGSSVLLNSFVFPLNLHLRNNWFSSYFGSGFFAGCLVSPLLYVFEVKKTQRQLNIKARFNSKGLGCLSLREGLGMAMYFWVYNLCRQEVDAPPLLAGGLAGVSNWVLSYPVDVIKTRVFAGSTVAEAIKNGHLYRGVGIVLLRALVVNACVFQSYETATKYFEVHNKKK